MDLSLSVYGQTKIVIPIGCLGYTKYLTQKLINQAIYSLLLATLCELLLLIISYAIP